MSAYRDWYVGMKVVCVDDENTHVLGLRELEVGRVYTVSWIGVCHWHGGSALKYGASGIGIEVDGVRERGKCVPFAAARFRPVQTRKTDISIFTAMLTDQRQKEPAQ